MNQWLRRLELPIVTVLFLAGSAFLLKLAYLKLLVSTSCGILFLLAFYAYVKQRYGVRVPLVLLCLVFAGIEVDAIGNYFHRYNRPFGPLADYDEFAHFTVPIFVTPVIVWLLREGIERFRYRLPLGLITFFAITTTFSLTAFYEVIELWDETVFGGKRIWTLHDTSNDLQMDLAGIIIGALLAYAVLKSSARSAQRRVEATGAVASRGAQA